MNGHRRDLLAIFAHHKVAANLLMLIMILAGAYALRSMNVQFFPNFALDYINVRVVWSGASAEDVESGITVPLEQRLKNVDGLRRMTSTSSDGVSSILLEYEEGTDMLLALDEVKRLVDEVRSLPEDSETPVVIRINNYEPVARLLVTGVEDPRELRGLVHRFENELLARGIDRVQVNGLPDEQIGIELGVLALERLGTSLDAVGSRVGAFSLDAPAGILGRADGERELRARQQRRSELDFASIPVANDARTRIELGSVADIRREARDRSVTLESHGHPAVELALQRTQNGDSLESARILQQWLADTRPTLPPGIELRVYDESWHLIRERIMLLVKNGAGGLVLVIAILYAFLTGRVAFWVAVGIPVSFMATLFILYLAGGSINMISLFALIMALGIIVDDAIVVGEDAQAHHQMGEDPLLAAEGGARRMLAPVTASSLTTIAAFLPLMMIGGIIGSLLFTIPLVIVAVITASLVESFLVLPGHLRHSFLHQHEAGPRSLRARLDRGFQRFRDGPFRTLVTTAIAHRGSTLALAVALLIGAFGLLAGGRMNFEFFPSPEATVLHANAAFVAGTPRATVDAFGRELQRTLEEAERSFQAGHLVHAAVLRHGVGSGDDPAIARGDQVVSMFVELIGPDQRTVRNEAFIQRWRGLIRMPAGLESFTITPRVAGPPGRDVTIRLVGHDAPSLKAAALDLGESLATLPGVSDIQDDMPYGREQLVYALTPAGEALGLTVADLARQLRAAFDGRLVQIFQQGADELEVRVRLAAAERDRLAILQRLPIRLASGELVPLETVARWHHRQGFQALRHSDGRLAVEVQANVDRAQNTSAAVMASLEQEVLPALRHRYGVDYSFEGRSADQRETLEDMRTGVKLGLALIYLVLAWVFASYGWPLVVMTAIPFGLVGALLGHWILGIDVTILSLFGFFGLSGIVVNDSIILVTFYKQLRSRGLAVREALVEAACQRLRAVLLTSLTTIAGLTPLLFETSLQAQFLIPMATSIAFGLGFATLLILVFVPSLLSVYEDVHEALRRRGWLGSERPDLPRTAG